MSKLTCLTVATLALAASTLALADTYTLNWEPSTEREDGTSLVDPPAFEVYINDELAYSGADTSYEFAVEYGQTSCVSIYQLEGPLRSLAATRCYTTFASPPLPPKFRGDL